LQEAQIGAGAEPPGPLILTTGGACFQVSHPIVCEEMRRAVCRLQLCFLCLYIMSLREFEIYVQKWVRKYLCSQQRQIWGHMKCTLVAIAILTDNGLNIVPPRCPWQAELYTVIHIHGKYLILSNACFFSTI